MHDNKFPSFNSHNPHKTTEESLQDTIIKISDKMVHNGPIVLKCDVSSYPWRVSVFVASEKICEDYFYAFLPV